MKSNKIPNNLFQTWGNKQISPDMLTIMNTWREMNPQYNYFLFDDKDCAAFIKKHFSKNIYNAYCKIIPGAFKSDLFRCCVLYIYGGIYVDIDTICLNNIDLFLNDKIQFIVPIDGNDNISLGTHNLFNAFLGSVANHHILLNTINRIVYNIENHIIPFSNLDFCGPGVIGRATNDYLKLNETTSFIGKEGIYNKTICFLKFEKYTEYVKDTNGTILFQNKNGNKWIKEVYDKESQKNNCIDWGLCKNPIKN
jgi:mannosyltransferase OCH1-like enzyme